MTTIKASPKLVTVFGGSGFVGRHIVRALARRGYQVRVACRNPNIANFVQPLGNVGQVQPIQANLRYRWSVDRAVEGADFVVNAVGILFESGRQSFNTVQDFGARSVAEAARAAGAPLTHISAIGANVDSESVYARSKAKGEAGVLESMPDAVILRPSIVFGPEDSFFNRFADMARYSPMLPLLGGGKTRLQPVYVGDIAEAAAMSVDGQVAGGRVYELGGPEVMTFRECMEHMLEVVDRRRPLVSVPWSIAKLQGAILGNLPGHLLTSDQVTLLQSDNVVSEEAEKDGRTLSGLGIKAETVDAILPSYLWRYRVAGQYTRVGRHA
ncbi:complex I NDUFA9 subunit family protein [Tianweitania sp. BSSL-BM11]|uniref:Complex I NDUFA9 subunit family protein n=1 Tax=Tianweitania aestuarii TaxID=2814886 RepID=A0ABS5RPV2_9HYPH|nr:complex I NDUFA9 subunit family protein [Tianweitania aestuarii]MBS9719078.1 complex I NDUFA9 subunit family protein [Tianweitania aestuarii]